MNRHSSYSAPRSERPSGSYGGQRGRSNKRNTYNKRSWKDNRSLFNLVCFILPFIILNLIILFLAVSTPKIEYTVSDTQDYKTVELSVKIRSLLPIKEMTVSGIISALSGKHCIRQLHADPQAGVICSLVKFSRVCGNPEMTCLSLIADSASYFGKPAFFFGKQVFRSKPAYHLRCISIFSCCIGYLLIEMIRIAEFRIVL